jgi:hypothetical protein
MDYYDDLKEWQSMQARMPAADADRERLNNTIREGRQSIQGGPTIPHHVIPPVYQGDVITPFGHPNAMNASVAVGAIAGIGTRQAPFQFV